MTSVRTNLGPLTTPFTYPASCNVVVQECSTCTFGWQGQSCGTNSFNTQGVQDNLDCWPPRSNDVSSGVAVNGWGFYSPGLECPIGYTSACSSTAGAEGGFTFQFAMLPRETAVGCCPTGYTCNYNPGVDAAQTCYKYHYTGSFPTVQCSAGTSNRFSYVTVPATVTATTTSTDGVRATDTVVLENILVFAPLIQINWQSTDRTTPSSTVSVASPIITSTSQPTGSSSNITTTTSNSSRLSKGATIGIAVGATVLGLILIAVFTIWMRRRKQRPHVMPTLPPHATTEYKMPHEIGTLYVAEAPTERDAHEVDGSMTKGGMMTPRYEMAG